MRIAMVAACPFPWPRGTPIRIHRMAEALGRRGHDVHVVTYHLADHTATPSMTVHRIAGPRWYSRTAPGPTLTKLALLDPLLTRKLRGLLRAISFDVIHAHHYEGLLAALFARARRVPPIVFDSHTLLESELPHYGRGFESALRARVGRMLDRCLPKRAQHVVAVSDDMRTNYEAAGLPSAGITVISNGVEVEHFRANRQNPGDGRLLAFAGNLARYQRIDLLLAAFAEVRRRDERIRLRLLTSDDFGPFRALCERLGIDRGLEVRRVERHWPPGRQPVGGGERGEVVGDHGDRVVVELDGVAERAQGHDHALERRVRSAVGRAPAGERQGQDQRAGEDFAHGNTHGQAS
jgi:glycosyltransferase involved in cell wall biosynthesis